MQNDQRNPTDAASARGGGVFVALGTLAGTVIGGLLGQPSLGFLAGLGGGILLHGLLWYMDSRKR